VLAGDTQRGELRVKSVPLPDSHICKSGHVTGLSTMPPAGPLGWLS
jgi:hypothetical protein